MVRDVAWIDKKLPAVKTAANMLAPSRVEHTAIWLGEETSETGRVAYGEGTLTQVAPTVFGVYPAELGVHTVPVDIGVDGRVSRIYPPTTLSPDTPVIGVGDAGEKLLKSATSDYVDEQLAPAREQLDELDEKLNDPVTGLAATQQKANDAAASAEARRQEVIALANTVDEVADQAGDAWNKAVKAENDASAANSEALAAAGIANGKGKVIFQASAPTGANANANNLWIRTSDNKPHTWDGTKWIARTDKAATDAAAAAAAADSKAVQAQADASAASQAASSATSAAATAQLTADGKNKVIRSTAVASGTTGYKAGDVWWRFANSTLTGPIIGQWTFDGSVWRAATIDSEIIASLTVDKITAGTGKFQTAVIDKLVNDEAYINSLYTNKIVVGSPSNLLPNGWDEYGDTRGMYPDVFTYRDTTSFPSESGLSGEFYVASANATTRYFFAADANGKMGSIPVTPGETYLLDFLIRPSKANTRFYLEVRDQSGALIPESAYRVVSGPSRGSGAYVIGAVDLPTGSTWWQIEITIPAGVTSLNNWRGYFNHTNGTVKGAAFAFAIRLQRQVGATLIGPGSVTTEKLDVTEEMVARLAYLGDAWINNLTVDQARIAGELIGEILSGKSIYGALIEGAKMVGGEYVLADSMDGLEPIVRQFSNTDVGWGLPPVRTVTVTGYATGGITGGRTRLTATEASQGFMMDVLGSLGYLTLSVPNAPFGGTVSLWLKPSIATSLRLTTGQSKGAWKACVANAWVKLDTPLVTGSDEMTVWVEQKHVPGTGQFSKYRWPAISVDVDRAEIIRVSPNPNKGQMRIGPDSNGSPEIKMTYGQNGASLVIRQSEYSSPEMIMDGTTGNPQIRIGPQSGGIYSIRLSDPAGNLSNVLNEGRYWSDASRAPYDHQAGLVVENVKTSTGAANAIWASNGQLRKTTSLRAAKGIIRDAPDTPALLNLEIHTWVDRAAARERALIIERNANREAAGQLDQLEPVPEIKRISGVIAEEVWELTGREELMTWDENSDIQGVQYDRLALEYAKEILAELRREQARNNQLEERLSRIEKLIGENNA